MGRLLRVASIVSFLSCVLVLSGWTIGKIVSDRWVWSQYLSWLPSVLVVPAAALLWLQGLAALKLSGRRVRGDRVLRVGVEVWVLLAAAYWGLFECRVYRISNPARPTGPHLRVLNWNVSAILKMEQITVPVLAQRPDVAILVNPNSYAGWSQAPAAFGPEYSYTNVGGIVILTRVPLLRYGLAWLGMEGLAPETEGADKRKARADPGRAMFIELDTTAQLGRPCIMWVIDLPSEPDLSRVQLVSRTAEKIRAWTGVGAAEPSGFPAADLIMGDFNIPRGSASLSRIAPGMKNAFDEAGTGYGATWPRHGYRTPIPLLQIDQTFVGARLRTARYEVVEPGFGYHRMQVGDYVARP